MKYKKQIATGAFAITLLISGTNVFAATPQDLGIKSTQSAYQKLNKNNKSNKNSVLKEKIKNNVVGTVGAVNDAGFTLDLKNLKKKTSSSVDVKTEASTTYSKNGIAAVATDLAVGQKVIAVGSLDKTANILTAKTVKIVTEKK